jgi:hypothetical protein
MRTLLMAALLPLFCSTQGHAVEQKKSTEPERQNLTGCEPNCAPRQSSRPEIGERFEPARTRPTRKSLTFSE